MPHPFDTPIGSLDVYGETHASLKIAQAHTGKPYAQTLEAWSDALNRNQRITLGAFLESQGVNLSQAAEDVRTLNRAAAAKAEADAHVATLDADRVDQTGDFVMLDDPNLAAAIHTDEATFQKRWFEARRLDEASYGDPRKGREAWRAADRQMADANVDLLASMKRPYKLQAAAAPAKQLAKQLDRAWTAGATPGERARLLDAAIKDHRESVKMLSAANGVTSPARSDASGVRTLDASSDENLRVYRQIKELQQRENIDFSEAARRWFA